MPYGPRFDACMCLGAVILARNFTYITPIYYWRTTEMGLVLHYTHAHYTQTHAYYTQIFFSIPKDLTPAVSNSLVTLSLSRFTK